MRGGGSQSTFDIRQASLGVWAREGEGKRPPCIPIHIRPIHIGSHLGFRSRIAVCVRVQHLLLLTPYSLVWYDTDLLLLFPGTRPDGHGQITPHHPLPLPLPSASQNSGRMHLSLWTMLKIESYPSASYAMHAITSRVQWRKEPRTKNQKTKKPETRCQKQDIPDLNQSHTDVPYRCDSHKGMVDGDK